MSFFLLGKHPDGRLRLLSEDSFPTRQDAMGELSRLTASPLFDAWDADVFVVDTDSGTPVLLVRPSVPDTDATPVGPEIEDATDPALTAVMLDLGVSGADSGADPEPVPEADLDAPPGQYTVPAAIEARADESGTEEVAADVFVAESEPPGNVVDAAWAAAVEQTTDAEDLKGALQRTAAKMEAEGISAPESVGSAAAAGLLDEIIAPRAVTESPSSTGLADAAPVEEEPAAHETPDARSQEEADNATEPASTPSGESAESTLLEADDVDGDEEVSPSADEAANSVPDLAQKDASAGDVPAEEPLADADLPNVDEGPTEGGGWPWDISADPDSAPPLAALDEHAEDSESMIRAIADDDSSRTVVLGEYAIDDVKGSEPFLDAAKRAAADEAGAEQVPESESEIASDTRTAEQPGELTEVEAPDDEAAPSTDAPADSDFVELGQVAPAAPAKVYEPGDIDMDSMTCDDCVYVDTCPNKDEREPANCGSFQWK